MDEPETQVRLEMVEATMSSPIFHDKGVDPAMAADIVAGRADVPGSVGPPGSAGEPGPAEPPEPESAEPPELPRIAGSRWVGFETAIIAAVSVAAAFLAGDARAAIIVGSLGLAVVGVRLIDRHVTFSFGEGFVGYRGDPGWPRGVQEDDDVHWNWTRPTPR